MIFVTEGRDKRTEVDHTELGCSTVVCCLRWELYQKIPCYEGDVYMPAGCTLLPSIVRQWNGVLGAGPRVCTHAVQYTLHAWRAQGAISPPNTLLGQIVLRPRIYYKQHLTSPHLNGGQSSIRKSDGLNDCKRNANFF